jgi:hypothetical protein
MHHFSDAVVSPRSQKGRSAGRGRMLGGDVTAGNPKSFSEVLPGRWACFRAGTLFFCEFSIDSFASHNCFLSQEATRSRSLQVVFGGPSEILLKIRSAGSIVLHSLENGGVFLDMTAAGFLTLSGHVAARGAAMSQ